MQKERMQKKSTSVWSPLQHSIFKRIWIAAFVSNVGTWMNDAASAWLMTSLTTKPLLVALVQAASTLPIFLLALPAGALADIVDRRFYLLMLQSSMAIIAVGLTLVVFFHHISPISLLFFTFGLGACSALVAPAWQAFIPEMVPPNLLSNAITLASVGSNLAKGIGPALAGIIIVSAGPVAVFAINAISFLGIIAALGSWRRDPLIHALPAERFLGAMRAGARYVRSAPGLHAVIIRAFVFFLFASASWALLPLIVRVELGRSADSYGVLLGLLGLGTVIGAFLLPSLRLRFNPNQLTNIGTLMFSVTTLLLALSENFYFICVGMLFGGIAWITTLVTLNTVAQVSVAFWVRARALAIYLIAFFGGMAVGSTVWGIVATHFSIRDTLTVAALGLLLSVGLTPFFSLKVRRLDHTPAGNMPAPNAPGIEHEQGPVMITVEYKIDRSELTEFIDTMRDIRLLRLRDGAFFWNLFNDIEHSNRFVECFMVESWLEHLRQHERISISDRKVIDRVVSFHRGKNPPLVEHFVASEVLKSHGFHIFH